MSNRRTTSKKQRQPITPPRQKPLAERQRTKPKVLATSTTTPPKAIADNSRRKVYWSFNHPDDLADKVVRNDAPNGTGQGVLASDDASSSIVDRALKLGAGKSIEGKINALDMRDGGITLSLWTKDAVALPSVRLTQIVDDVVLADKTQAGSNFQSRCFDALVIAHSGDQLTITATRPNTSPHDGSNDGKGAVKRYTVALGNALKSGKPWHHVVVLWDGDLSDVTDSLRVIVDGNSFLTSHDTGTSSVDGTTPSTANDFYQSEGESIPASRFILSAGSAAAEIDEVELIKGIASAELIRALGASRHSSGLPLIVWSGGGLDPYDNESPIPGPMTDALCVVAKGTVSVQSGAYVLNGSSYLESVPHDLFIDDSLAVAGWFKPNSLQGQVPLFEVDLGVPSTAYGVSFKQRQGLNVAYDATKSEMAVTVVASDLDRHEISTAKELKTAIQAVLKNTISNRKFKIVICANITLTEALPSLVGGKFVSSSASKLAPATQLTIESEGSPPKYISGDDKVQILVIDADDAIINLRNLELRRGYAQGGASNGGGGGLGAGGALFIAAGEVNIDNVLFANNTAEGGGQGAAETNGKGGDAGSEELAKGTRGAAGARPNTTGESTYYPAIGIPGLGGEGGSGTYSHQGEGVAKAGIAGDAGGWGCGGGQGGGGQGGATNENNDRGGSGGDGGKGGFGGGGGGGGGAGGHGSVSTKASGGDGGEKGEYGGEGVGGFMSPAGTESRAGKNGDMGGSGAGLGGAIFIADTTRLSPGSAAPRVSIAGTCRFTGNVAKTAGVYIYYMGESHGDAIAFEGGVFYNNSGAAETPFPESGVWPNPKSSTTYEPESFTYRFAAHDFAGDWHHVAASFASGDTPRIYLDGIPLSRADKGAAVEVNKDSGFAATQTAVMRWGHVDGVAGNFSGQVSGLKLFDRGLFGGEVFDDAATASLQRLIVELDDSQDTKDTASYLLDATSSVYFNTARIKLVKGAGVAVVGPSGKTWADIRARLGEGLVLELVGTGNGAEAGYTAQTTLSGYTPEELCAALRSALPGGIQAADMFISARHFADPSGFDDESLDAEHGLDPATEPATMRFSCALINAGVTNGVNIVPLMRFNEQENQLELKQVTDQWVLYNQITAEHPVLLDYVYADPEYSSIVTIGWAVYSLLGTRDDMKSLEYDYIQKKIDGSTPKFTQQGFDGLAEDGGARIGKGSSASDKARSKSAAVYDVFRANRSKGLKIYFKDKKHLGPGVTSSRRGVKLGTALLAGLALGSGTSLFDKLNKHTNKGNPLFDGGKNHQYKRGLTKNAKYAAKSFMLPALGAALSIRGAVQVFKTGNPLDIVKGSLMLISGVILPLVETTMVLLAELEICAAAGPAAPYVALAALVIDLCLFVAGQIRRAVQRNKMTKKAAQFAAEGFAQMIADLKESLGDVEDLYISGRFSGAQPEKPTSKDVLTGVTSWLYQALDGSCDHSGQSMSDLLRALHADDKEMPVPSFIQALIDGNLSYAVRDDTRKRFEAIYKLWTSGESGLTPTVDVDLVSDRTLRLENDNLVASMQQFLGERLDDGGMQSDTTATFTAGEALALDGSNIAQHTRNMAVYGADGEGLREEIRTGKGNNTVMLGLGEFHVEMVDGNNTVYLTDAFKGVADASNQQKYHLHAGDIADTNIGMQLKRDNDTLVIDGSAHVNLAYMTDKNMADGKAKQAVLFRDASAPLLVSGFESVYGSHEDDTLVSNPNKCATLTANAGNNIMVTGFGAASQVGAKNLINQLKGGTGNDKLYGSHAGGQGYNYLSGGEGGHNVLIADKGINVLECSKGSDVLVAAIHPDKVTDNILSFGFGAGRHRIEKGRHAFEVSVVANGPHTNGIHFAYPDADAAYTYPADAPIVDAPAKVRDILQFGPGVSADNVRVSVGRDPKQRTEPNSMTPINTEVTFSLVIDDTRVFDALIGDDLTRPNLQTGDAITIKGNWSHELNCNHRVRVLRFGDGSSLEVAGVNQWDTSATIYADTPTLTGNTFYQGFSGNDKITSNGGGNVIVPGSGRNVIDINGANDQVMITRNPLRTDTIKMAAASAGLRLVLDGSIRLRDLGFAVSGPDLTLTIGQGGNLIGATQTVTVSGAQRKLMLRFAAGFTLDLSALDIVGVSRGDSDDQTLTATGPSLLWGGFGNDTLTGGQTGPSVFVGGAGANTLEGSGDNSDDLYIIEDQGGIEALYGAGRHTITTVQNKVVLLVSSNADPSAKGALGRADIWFATSATLGKMPPDYDHEDVPRSLAELSAGELLVWVRGQENGVVIKDWAKWDDSNRLVVTNAFEGAFAISKAGVATLSEVMDRYVDVESKTYSPWHPDLGNDDATFALNKDLSEAVLAVWSPTSSVFTPGRAPLRSAKASPPRVKQTSAGEQKKPAKRVSAKKSVKGRKK